MSIPPKTILGRPSNLHGPRRAAAPSEVTEDTQRSADAACGLCGLSANCVGSAEPW